MLKSVLRAHAVCQQLWNRSRFRKRRRQGGEGLARSEQLEIRSLLSATLVKSPLPAKQAAPLPTVKATTPVKALSSLPQLNSNPGAKASLFLDFDGHTEAVWGSHTNVVTPAFSTDGDRSTFSSEELSQIVEIWARVAEDFAPFNINVTTVEPASFANGVSLRVAIGGSYKDWLMDPAGGVAYLNSFTNSYSNVVYAFSDDFGTSIKGIAEVASHEAGHGFGLEHQSLYNSSGIKLEEYNPGNAAWAPIMGVGYYSARTTWYNGANSLGSKVLQDDMSVIARAANGFGYRTDDVGNTFATGTSFNFNKGTASASGIISKTNDLDVFIFAANAGPAKFVINPAAYEGNLLIKAELRTKSGTLIASGTNTTLTTLTLAANLNQGEYQLIITSDGSYGSVGQYSVTATANATTIGAPVLGKFDTTIKYTEGAIALRLDTDATVVDKDSKHFGGGYLVAAITSGGETADVLSIRTEGTRNGQINVHGNQVRHGSNVIGTFTGGVGTTPLTVTFTDLATPAAVQALVRNLQYSNTSKAPSTVARTVSVSINDGVSDDVGTGTKTINVIAKNDPPVISGFDSTLRYVRNTNPVLLDDDATVTDVDSPDFNGGKLTVKLASGAATTDRLEIRNQGNAAGQVGVVGNQIRYGGIVIGTFTGGTGSSALVVTFNSSANATAVQAVLRNITFRTVNANTVGKLRKIQVQLTDGDGGTSIAASKSLSVV
ncbi:zinc-dependent metalloprotease family protein [Planctomicrobium sp. SH664]|uniref:zinc-dependent metalloprotease family protein n=1 Tax=Planctomicrobium sp. SH664 TaxID=3448125 RepID=UPI003F5C1678